MAGPCKTRRFICLRCDQYGSGDEMTIGEFTAAHWGHPVVVIRWELNGSISTLILSEYNIEEEAKG